MSSTAKYQGIFPAFYACYDSRGEVSPQNVRRLTRHLLDQGVHGLYVGGSSGECIYCSPQERKMILENVVAECNGQCVIIAHVACNNTHDSQDLAAHAQSLGVDAIAAIPPIYFKLPPHAIAAYWNDISRSAPNTDFIIYNIPQLAGVSLTVPLLQEMRKNPCVIGVKNSSMPVQDILDFKAAGGKNFVVFNGPDEQLVAGLAVGADGGIGGTYGVMPQLFLQAYRLFLAGDVQQAKALQGDICAIIALLCSAQGSLYAVSKGVLRLRADIDCGSVRPPLSPLAPQDSAVIEAAAAAIDRATEKYCRS